MHHAEFEEKDYEAPLYNQLLSGSGNIATPGQVFEGKFGIDATLEALSPLFWHLCGYPSAPSGVHLCDYNWGFIWRRLGRKRALPNFSVNLLVQSKRPSVLQRSRGELYARGIRGPFWRFSVRENQQAILVKVATTLGNKALVIYAAPAFHTLDLLYKYTNDCKMVENSSFVRIGKMAGHETWNYDCPGTSGVASSEPEFVEDSPFEELLRRLAELFDPEASAADEISSLHKVVTTICKELSDENPLARFVVRSNQRIAEIAARLELGSSVSIEFVTMLNTFRILNVDWLSVHS